MKMTVENKPSLRLYVILTLAIFILQSSPFFSHITHASEKYKEGTLLLTNKEYISAANYFKSKISSETRDDGAYYYLAYSYYKMGEMVKALSEFKIAFKINSEFSIEKMDDVKQNKDFIKVVLNKDEPDRVEDRKLEDFFRQGLSSINSKSYANAENQFRELIENKSNNAKYYYYLGYVLYIQKQMPEAIKEFKISYSIDPAF